MRRVLCFEVGLNHIKLFDIEETMYSTQIHTFLMVCDKGSFNKAATELYITPSAVLQQINSLEKRLDVKLLTRNRGGIELTPAGEYLKKEAMSWVHAGDAIMEEVRAIAERENHISIGTSLLEKCRLLYELWMLYSAKNDNVKINMVSIDTEHRIPARTDLVESINSGVSWMKKWEFFRICDVPFGFAAPERHPVSKKDRISISDLSGETVVCFRDEGTTVIADMFECMVSQGINLDIRDYPSDAILWGSGFKEQLLLVPMCWNDILPGMKLIPCEWDYCLPYGIFYRKNASETVRRFLGFIRKTYTEGNEQGIVPVLM
ncbi:LysR family transcriptional regulator [Oribacterium sp. WCC10]|uniref:LysR family transcriptional regulator n=1 Tax=Oribacterium sp. WCC10 TaxID=1855343 RepID=UPI0008F1D769|nr:LysR family transcriptional regulator [Oribacterium sp. WCC10]SFG16475.1 DNA-binding transcriptional regulator, LysR family [Oribacterium sp. WCC10]